MLVPGGQAEHLELVAKVVGPTDGKFGISGLWTAARNFCGAHDDEEPVRLVPSHLEARVVARDLPVHEGTGLRRWYDRDIGPAARLIQLLRQQVWASAHTYKNSRCVALSCSYHPCCPQSDSEHFVRAWGWGDRETNATALLACSRWMSSSLRSLQMMNRAIPISFINSMYSICNLRCAD